MYKNQDLINIKRRILIVDDELINRTILTEMLKDTYEILTASDGEEALEILNKEEYIAIVLLDLLMPKVDGFEVLKRKNANINIKDIPVIVSTSEKEMEVKSLKLGASDFIKKPYDDVEVIKARIAKLIDLYESKIVVNKTREDELTGLLNAEAFNLYGEGILLNSKKHDLIAIRLTNFIFLHDYLGSEKSNAILKNIAKKLVKFANKNNGIACRSHDDYFYVLIDHISNYEKMVEVLNNELSLLHERINLKVKIGVYQNVDKSSEINVLCDRAMSAVDLIDDQTQNIAFYDTKSIEQNIYIEKLISDFDNAIKNEEFIIYYQPKFNIEGDKPKLEGAEALVRWIHPELGFISPGDFIPLFEKNGLIKKLDTYVLQKVCKDLKFFKENYSKTLQISVNFSRNDFFDLEIKRKVDNILAKNNLEHKDIHLEVTESAYTRDGEQLIEVLNLFRNDNYLIEMDDFGTGYSTLNAITDLPFDYLKLDMIFMRKFDSNLNSRKVIEFIMNLSKTIGVKTVAEGVETKEQCDFLKSLGCNLIQGYYLSKPLKYDDFILLLEKER